MSNRTASPLPAGLPEDLAVYRLLTSDEAALLLAMLVTTLRTWRSRRRGCGGEAPALRRGDIDLNYPIAPGTAKPVAHITGTVVYDPELGGLYRQPCTKSNGAGDRTVILPPFVATMLRERMIAGPPNQHETVFATRSGTWLSLTNINTRLRGSILKDTNIGARFERACCDPPRVPSVAAQFGAEAAAARGRPE